MDSIDNILNFIDKKTKEEIEKIRNDNKDKCDKILDDAKKRVAQHEKELEEKFLLKQNEIKSIFENELKNIRIKTILCKKEEIVENTIKIAYKSFCEDKSSVYYGFIEKLIYKNIPNEELALVFGKKDYKRFNSIFAKILDEHKNIYKITCSDEFSYGFKFILKNYILDFDIKNMFFENNDKLKIIVLNIFNMKGH